jgi:hypothetical protein
MVEREGYWALLILFASLAAILSVMGMQRTFDVVIVPVVGGSFTLANNRPDSETFRPFLQELLARAAASQNVERTVVRNVLRVLHDEGMLDEWKYRSALEHFAVADP